MARHSPLTGVGGAAIAAKKEKGHCLHVPPLREAAWGGRLGCALPPPRCDTTGGVAEKPAMEDGRADKLTWIPPSHSERTTSSILSSARMASID
ncbi:hypothetical protein E2C01_010565 [Portunus trituberculatus]|uniref:Uncharacterized protein n=1 Tax=Portunus trituberculatus TaxID=210409 RepID=A0A5B7D8Q3_PORTR|nr:hypothetical protein [Portunus trituberculatus]